MYGIKDTSQDFQLEEVYANLFLFFKCDNDCIYIFNVVLHASNNVCIVSVNLPDEADNIQQ